MAAFKMEIKLNALICVCLHTEYYIIHRFSTCQTTFIEEKTHQYCFGMKTHPQITFKTGILDA